MNQAASLLTALVEGRRTAPPVRFLAEEESLALFTLNAYLEEERRWDGASLHQVFDDWLRSGRVGEDELKGWLQEWLSPKTLNSERFERAEKRAVQWLKAGLSVVSLPDGPEGLPHPGTPQTCRLLFALGEYAEDRIRAGIFNSRKSRLPDPHADWLQALRNTLAAIEEAGAGVAGSLGTLTYDLVTAYARQRQSSLLLVLPLAVEEILSGRYSIPLPGTAPPELTLTCLTGAMDCASATRSVCRDRLLGYLSDVHFLIEVRSNGNMARILYEQQAHSPRRQAIFQPKQQGTGNGGNRMLQETFPRWAVPFSLPAPRIVSPAAVETDRPPVSCDAETPIQWEEYLYHYTRSCPGPWPGQSYEEYLLDLLAAAPFSGHTSLDTLIRIMTERRIRACGQLVRGGHAAVSLTSLPPMRLESLRRWNPALIRWTFEPYGIAIKRKLLRQRGSKPAIYAHASCYAEIRARERYRFQLHKPPWSSWKYEREWRFREDIDLRDLTGDDAFLFVPSSGDAQRLKESVDCPLPVAIIPAGGNTSSVDR